MILQALNDYYKRLYADPAVEISGFGFGRQGVHFCLTIDKDGNVIDRVLDLRDNGKAYRIEVPGPVKKTSGISSNFCWENTGYVLGVDKKANSERTAQTHAAFKERAREVLSGTEDEGAQALLAFLQKWNPVDAEKIGITDDSKGLNIVFRFNGERRFLHERSAIRNAWLAYLNANLPGETNMCLVTGEPEAPIPSIHSSIKGVPGSQSSGAALISFNLDAAESFGKKQNFNAPVSAQAAFAYTTTLNHLLTPGSRRKVQVGDTTVVFWTNKPTMAEKFFGIALGGKEAEDEGEARDIEAYLRSVSLGVYPSVLGNRETPFYTLGLSPNAARLSVRFWHIETVGAMADNIGAHFQALRLKPSFENDPEHPRPWWILKEIAAQRDSRNISPLLSGQLIRAIVKNQTYPRTLFTAAISRIRADKKVNYLRACIIKAYLTRNAHKEISMSLDKNTTDTGYRLGRLFAIVERIQSDAVPGANTTVRDRFFGAASATPARIFPVILKNAQHNLAKIRKDKPGWAVNLDKSIQEILETIDPAKGFPASMPLEKQGMFVLGYYQQRQELYTKKDDKIEE